MGSKLPLSWYLNPDVLHLSRELIGKRLCTQIDGILTTGTITETEAYAGITDKASHAYGGRRTNRTEIMYKKGGVAYVYLCYGIHHLFNIVTNAENVPHAILIRGIHPEKGIHEMLKRRKKKFIDRQFTGGPGSVSKALGIQTLHTGISLLNKTIWIEDMGIVVPDKHIIKGPRVGVDYAGDHALLPWRFLVSNEFKF